MNRLLIAIIVLSVSTGCSMKSGKSGAQQEQMAQEKMVGNPPMPNMPPEEMMAKMKEAGTPGEEHERLKPLVGNWKTEGKFWMDPAKEPEVSKGSANRQWMMGKRFVKEDFKGKWMGQPFQGMGLMGYDKTKKEYLSTWLDSMGTGLMISEGRYDDANKAIDFNGKFTCPITGGERKGHTVVRILSNNEHVVEMYDFAPDGKEFKVMEITYKRSKG